MLDIIAVIYALGESQKEIAAFMNELKNSTPKPNKKASDKAFRPRQKASYEELAIAVGKGPKKTPSFVTQKDFIGMLEKELHMSSED
ncbi:hypothetical protein C1H46_012568 [Malus baccata]|uniref:Uncharacterized protein n=1 Tax=Malus baccata TaxID=106549 RepID=A0A540MSL6_MALBA|nr:hypothetical protein C1H46_012568 [Malus baccata]